VTELEQVILDVCLKKPLSPTEIWFMVPLAQKPLIENEDDLRRVVKSLRERGSLRAIKTHPDQFFSRFQTVVQRRDIQRVMDE
jgi:hypothetical protein